MKKILLAISVVFICNTAHSAVLTIDLGNSSGSVSCSTGSCFGESGAGYYVNISGYQGLVVDGETIQPASGSHSGAPDGSESPGIDNPWEWLGNTGMFFTTTPVAKVGGSGNNVMLDMSGLNITWNGDTVPRVEEEFNLPNDPVAVTCQFNCGDGESYTLTAALALPGECHPVYGDPSCFGAVYRYYDLTLRGTIAGNDISTVPVPAAIWLFVSGIVGLVSLNRIQKNRS